MKKKFLIVGQGLSGSLMAFQLLQHGQSVTVVDEGHLRSASKIAAGIVNPLVLKRLTKTWRAEAFLSFNQAFYPSLEKAIGAPFYFQRNIQKLISSDDEINFWQHRYQKAVLDAFIEEELTDFQEAFPTWKDYKSGLVKSSFWLNFPVFLDQFRSYLSAQNLLIDRPFDYQEVKLAEKQILYQDEPYDELLFCEGASAVANPFFNWLPFSLNKGELLVVHAPELNPQSIIHKKIFVLPLGDHRFKVGATYDWKEMSRTPTAEKQGELEKMLQELISVDFEVEERLAEIRPAVIDRRPLVGRHPENPALVIFNGMGSRGALMAPLLAEECYQYLLSDEPLHPECSIERFFKKYFTPS